MGDFLNLITSGELTFASGVVFIAIAFIVSAVGGAIGGIVIGGKHLGNDLAAMMGSFYGPLGAVPGVLIALIILLFI